MSNIKFVEINLQIFQFDPEHRSIRSYMERCHYNPQHIPRIFTRTFEFGIFQMARSSCKFNILQPVRSTGKFNVGAIISGQLDIAYQIIKRHMIYDQHDAAIFNEVTIENILNGHGSHAISIQRYYCSYQKIWFCNIFDIDRFDIFPIICPDAPKKKSKLLCWLIEKQDFMVSVDYLQKMAWRGEREMFRYLINNSVAYRERIFENGMLAQLIACTIYGNRLELYRDFAAHKPRSVDKNYIYNVNICFLRVNRIDLYTQYQNVPSHHYFKPLPIAYLFHYYCPSFVKTLPLISLATFEYYVGRYNLPTKLSGVANCELRMQAASVDIYQKYLTLDIITPAFIATAEYIGRQDLMELIKTMNGSVNKLM